MAKSPARRRKFFGKQSGLPGEVSQWVFVLIGENNDKWGTTAFAIFCISAVNLRSYGQIATIKRGLVMPRGVRQNSSEAGV
jgi:hypothetical protein